MVDTNILKEDVVMSEAVEKASVVSEAEVGAMVGKQRLSFRLWESQNLC